jgi:hypothetical protein
MIATPKIEMNPTAAEMLKLVCVRRSAQMHFADALRRRQAQLVD